MPLLDLSFLGRFEETLGDLYPYRYPLTALFVAAAVAALALAYRGGAHRVLWRYRLATTVVGVPLLVVAGLVADYTLSPLWERTRLEEASPLDTSRAVDAPGSGGATAMVMDGPSLPRTLQRGDFRGADAFHFGRGQALIIEAEPGRHVLRFEDFSVRNGPDLYVYLSRDASGAIDESLNLGRLKATDGAFNYELPAGIDVSGVRSVVVWCRQFAVLFAVAPLM